jgi:hypothetical protein
MMEYLKIMGFFGGFLVGMVGMFISTYMPYFVYCQDLGVGLMLLFVVLGMPVTGLGVWIMERVTD